MTSGLDNLSLALFTALAPAGVVAFIVLALARIFSADHDRAVRIDRMIALPFAVALLGFIASATHLGTPANALHVFAGVGTSPLSNEVLSAVVFLFLSGSYWMAAFKVNFPDALAKPAGCRLPSRHRPFGLHFSSLCRANRAYLEYPLHANEPHLCGFVRRCRFQPDILVRRKSPFAADRHRSGRACWSKPCRQHCRHGRPEHRLERYRKQ